MAAFWNGIFGDQRAGIGRLEPFVPARSPSHCTAHPGSSSAVHGSPIRDPRLHPERRHVRFGLAPSARLTADETPGTLRRPSPAVRICVRSADADESKFADNENAAPRSRAKLG